MSIETIYKCDHCGTRCSGDERATIAEWKEPTTITFGKAVHGCSKEHLGIALAKMFGIGVNGEADELLNRKQRELTKLTDANNFLVTERDNMRARLAELEARMPANEVTNAEREALNKACLDAVSAAASAEHRLDLAKERIVELEKRFAELTPPDTSTESGLPGAVLAAITLPTKPTKPLRERLEELAAYWYRGDKDDKELNGAYRLARRECAKELREVINDPR